MRPFGLLRSATVGAVCVALGLAACDSVETTGGALFTFHAYAAGPPNANGGQPCGSAPGAPLTFTGACIPGTSDCYEVTLTSARVQIGAVYLVEGAYNGGSQNSSCFELGVYCGEVPGGVPQVAGGQPGVNLLCPDATEFTVVGNGNQGTAGIGEIWLTGGQHSCVTPEAGLDEAGAPVCQASSPDVNSMDDTTPIVSVSGFACPPGAQPCTATSKGAVHFEGTVTISAINRGVPSMPGLPGDDPICKERIIVIDPLRLALRPGGALYVRTDPRGWFNQVDFCVSGEPDPLSPKTTCMNGLTLRTAATGSAPAVYSIPDTSLQGGIGETFFQGILSGALPSGASAYSFEYTAAP